jgi:transcriptional regulator with XRE-family HTH domain
MSDGWDQQACAHRLRVTRIALGITEQEAADAHGVTVRTYRKWEAGANQRSIRPTLRFAEKFDVSMDWLLGGEGFNVGRHLQRGKVAILPVTSAEWQRRVAEGIPRLGGAA